MDSPLLPDGLLWRELPADGIQVSNAVDRSNWDEDPIQLAVCETCGELHCNSNGWMSPRRAGDYVLFLPPFEDMLQFDGYKPPYFFWKGPMLLDRVRFAELRRLVPALPDAGQLKPLSGREALWLIQSEAPAGVLDQFPDPAQFWRELLLATDHESDDRAAGMLEGLLAAAWNSEEPFTLKPLAEGQRRLSFYLDRTPGFAEWQPMAVAGERAWLVLEPGYRVEGIPGKSTVEHWA